MIDEDSLPILAQHWLILESARLGETEAEDEFHQFQWMVESPPYANYGQASRDIRESQEWSRNNIRGFWSSTSSRIVSAFFFSDRTDAMLFVLSRGGQLVDLRPFITSQP
jgi:hypothetical protein